MEKSKKAAWTATEDSLLLKLKSKKLPYREILEYFSTRTQDSLRNHYYELVKLNNNAWLKDERIAILDIETTDLNSVYGFMLSWAIIYEDGTKIGDVVTQKEIRNFSFDKRITKSLIKELNNIDVVVGYYSKRFDIPFVRSRALFHGIEFPSPKSIRHIDLYDAVKRKLAMPRNSLAVVTKYLGIEGKNNVESDFWLKARYGDKESLEYVYDHNLRDIDITLELYKKLKPLVIFTKSDL